MKPIKPIELKFEPLNDAVSSQEPISGRLLLKAPQPALTAPDSTAFSGSFDNAAITRIQRTETRVLELEKTLIRLNLLKVSGTYTGL